jgi:hypothetical protein
MTITVLLSENMKISWMSSITGPWRYFLAYKYFIQTMLCLQSPKRLQNLLKKSETSFVPMVFKLKRVRFSSPPYTVTLSYRSLYMTQVPGQM